MNENLEKEVFSNDIFVRSLFEMNSAEAAQAALREKGVELSIEELKAIRSTIIENVNTGGIGVELSSYALDNIASGVSQEIMVRILDAKPNVIDKSLW